MLWLPGVFVRFIDLTVGPSIDTSFAEVCGAGGRSRTLCGPRCGSPTPLMLSIFEHAVEHPMIRGEQPIQQIQGFRFELALKTSKDGEQNTRDHQRTQSPDNPC